MKFFVHSIEIKEEKVFIKGQSDTGKRGTAYSTIPQFKTYGPYLNTRVGYDDDGTVEITDEGGAILVFRAGYAQQVYDQMM